MNKAQIKALKKGDRVKFENDWDKALGTVTETKYGFRRIEWDDGAAPRVINPQNGTDRTWARLLTLIPATEVTPCDGPSS